MSKNMFQPSRIFDSDKIRHPSPPLFPWPCGDAGQTSQLTQPSLKGAGFLCDLCKSITLNALESPCGFAHSGQVLERSASSANPCRLCNLIRSALKKEYLHQVQHVSRGTKRMSRDEAETTFSNILSTGNQNIALFGSESAAIALILDPPFPGPEDRDPPWLTIYTPYGSPSTGLTEFFVPCLTRTEAVGLASHWISECFTTHQKCPKATESKLPKRLIDLGRPDDKDNSVCLWLNPVWTEEEEEYRGPKGRYVALSYCWGTRSFTTLTPESQDSMVEGIDMACLPQTIRDAINITRSLGIRFLWVDALCILQGPCAEARNDWKEQSSQMAGVYENAILTIGAGTSEDAYQGIQHAAGFSHDLLALLPSTRSLSPYHSPVFVGPDCDARERYFSRLHTRAWTFQEQLLSTRYITFGLGGMLWECAHGRQFDNASIEPYYEEVALKLPTSPTFFDWHRLLEDYCQRQLTKPEDRLVALAGLRTSFLSLRAAQDRDVAGLWANHLSWDLLWEIQAYGKRNGDPFGMAPSWSWASVPYSISYIDADCFEEKHSCNAHCVSILGTSIKSVPTDLGMKIQGGIRVRGYMNKVATITNCEETKAIVDELGNKLNAKFDYEQPRGAKEAGWILTDHMNPPNLYCLHFHSIPGSMGLIITPTGQSQNEFRRMGTYRSTKETVVFSTPAVVTII